MLVILAIKILIHFSLEIIQALAFKFKPNQLVTLAVDKVFILVIPGDDSFLVFSLYFAF